MIVTPKPREQTRARYPDEEGYVEGSRPLGGQWWPRTGWGR